MVMAVAVVVTTDVVTSTVATKEPRRGVKHGWDGEENKQVLCGGNWWVILIFE